jgi:hypothetical protein
MLVNKLTNKSLIREVRRSFHLLTPEEYFVNMKESTRKMGIDSAKLLPLPEASKIY